MRQPGRRIEPLARKEGLVIQEVAGEVLVYDLDRHRAHCLNSTAAFVWRKCDGKTSIARIAESLGQREGAPINSDIVWIALGQLVRSNLLADSQEVKTRVTARSVSRRKMIRLLGVGTIVALPLITSLVAPTPAQAATCLPSGAACTLPGQCCSGLCQGGGTCA